MLEKQWIRCPVCGSKTRVKLREDSVLLNFPLYCPKCKTESLIKATKLTIELLKKPYQ